MTRAAKSTGERIALYRRRKGLSQPILAAMIGRSESWLSQVERGVRAADNLRIISRIAEALEVPIEDITGFPLRLGPDGAGHFAGVQALASTLAATTPLSAQGGAASAVVPRPVSTIRADIAVMHRMYQATRFSEEGEKLPTLLSEANVASQQGSSADQRTALVTLADAYLAAATLLRKVSEHDLAWVAADRALAASEKAGDNLMMVACAYRLAHIFLRSARIADAERMVDDGLAVLGDPVTSAGPEWHSLRGSLFLTAAIAAARRDERPAAMKALDRAGREAQEIGDDRNDYWTAFGPTNVAIHRVSVEVELGDPVLAIKAGRTVDLRQVAVGLVGRRTQVMLDLARARMRRKDIGEATTLLAQAETAAPESIRNSNAARDIVRQMVATGSASATLRDLARRMAIAS